MPSSVGMRRTTRVFGVVKGSDGARVLRSGRMLWPDSGDAKLRKGSDKGDWLRSIATGNVYEGSKIRGIGCDRGDDKGIVHGSRDDGLKQNGVVQDMDSSGDNLMLEKVDEGFDVSVGKCGDCGRADGPSKMFGIVYSRKRKDGHVSMLDGKRYGNCYHRRNKRQKKDISGGVMQRYKGIDIVANHGSSGKINLFSRFLYSVLKYMKTVRVRLSVLAKFVMAEPLCDVFLSGGVQLSQDSSSMLGAGFCKISGFQEHCPTFSVDFSAVPGCFMLMHCQMLRTHLYAPLAFGHDSAAGQTDGGSVVQMVEPDCEDELSCPAGENNTAPGVDTRVSRLMLHMSISDSKMETRLSLRRYGNSGEIRKRRSSLRKKQRRNHSYSDLNKCNGTLASDLISVKNNEFPFSSIVSSKKNRRPSRTRSAGNVDEISSVVSSSQNVEPVSCTANLLTMQFDQCLREEGVNIALVPSNSGEWCLVVKKGGVTRFMYRALDPMKPCFTNRSTRSTVWAGDNGWKLEFPDRDNWLKFKDLSKECFERNRQIASPRPSSTKIIPIPRVSEVLGYEKDHYATFHGPNSYIISKGDELSRAMTSKVSSYDMDSEDEEWLNVYNSDKTIPKSKLNEQVSDEVFERIIDAFEKDFYCNPHDLSDEKPAADICLEIANKDVVEAVYGYWTKKRKNRRSALVRVFQGHQPRKAFVPKPVFRKRRSFKRQASQHGRDKQPGFIEAMIARRDAVEEQAAMHKVQEAREFSNRSVDFAITKRQRAQFLTENADLATYRAAMALRIAEAAQVMESPRTAASHFLD